MNALESFRLLETDGDIIEQRICKDADPLASVIYTYAEVWAHCVYSRRKNVAEVEPDWMPFAGSHYSAIVRLHHAFQSKTVIEDLLTSDLLEKKPADALLLIHHHFACFWENLGSCIDNLALAIEDCELIEAVLDKDGKVDPEMKGSNARKSLTRKYAALAHAYDRRTQFIHSRLVPQKFAKGSVSINVRLLDSKNTSWPSESGIEESLTADVLEKSWHDTTSELGNAWRRLCMELKKKYPPQVPSAPESARGRNATGEGRAGIPFIYVSGEIPRSNIQPTG